MGLPVSTTAARAAGEDGPLVLDGELLLDERANEPPGGFAVVAGLEVRPALRAREDAAMEGDERQPFGLAAGPAEGHELGRRGAALSGPGRGSVRPRSRGVSSCDQGAIAAQVGDEDPHRIDDHQLGIDRLQERELE